MKVAVSAQGKYLESPTDPRFGRSPYFLIMDIDTLDFEAVTNPNVNVVGGAGIQSARLIIEQGVDLVITENCGPNAFRVLEAAGIKIFEGANGSVKEAIQAYKNGKLKGTLSAKAGIGKGRRARRVVWPHGDREENNIPNKYRPQHLSGPESITKDERVRLVKDEIQDLEKRLQVLNQKLTQIEKNKGKLNSN